jgi:hypothetical protein
MAWRLLDRQKRRAAALGASDDVKTEGNAAPRSLASSIPRKRAPTRSGRRRRNVRRREARAGAGDDGDDRTSPRRSDGIKAAIMRALSP